MPPRRRPRKCGPAAVELPVDEGRGTVKPGDRKRVPTVGEAVAKAASLVDPSGSDWAVTALLESFEDDERPATAVDDLVGELGSTVGGVDPEGDSPAAAMAAASAIWLATNIDSAGNRELVLRESCRLGFGERIPNDVRDWLEAEHVEL
jgi:hypothetical protein